MREGGDPEHDRESEHADAQPQQVVRAVHARGQQRLVPLDLVGVHDL
ncbi:hypothetical protein GA0115246_107501, partial [Streptomyces sp. SolWspMP-sol7th]